MQNNAREERRDRSEGAVYTNWIAHLQRINAFSSPFQSTQSFNSIRDDNSRRHKKITYVNIYTDIYIHMYMHKTHITNMFLSLLRISVPTNNFWHFLTVLLLLYIDSGLWHLQGGEHACMGCHYRRLAAAVLMHIHWGEDLACGVNMPKRKDASVLT